MSADGILWGEQAVKEERLIIIYLKVLQVCKTDDHFMMYLYDKNNIMKEEDPE